MARTVETRRTVRTTRVEGADEIKSNLNNVAAEIARVRDQAREEVNALEKIRGMLDTGYLNTLIKSIEDLETRIEELEDVSLRAQEDVSRHQRELEQEQDRLKKLWDAYKTQEDELDRLKRDYPLMEEKLFERERTVENLRRELARMEPLQKAASEADDLRREVKALDAEADRLDRELEKANDTIARMEEEVGRLNEVAADAGRVQELEQLLDEERERLAKLYKVYEETESEKKALQDAAGEWEAWFRKVAPAMESMCEAVNNAPQ
ncbi:MAG: hypothetical protein ACPHID_02495 [Thermoplasmatota archaeon]